MKPTGEILDDQLKRELSSGFSRTQAGTSGAPVSAVPTNSASTVVDGAVRRIWTEGDPITSPEGDRYYLNREGVE